MYVLDMKIKWILIATFAFFIFAPLAHAETPDFSSCKALRKEAFYRRYEEFMYLFEGKDGWFFRSKKDLRLDFRISEDRIAQFKRLSDALKSKGTDLVIAFPPTRAIAAAKMLPDHEPLMQGYDSRLAVQNYAKFIRDMNRAGIHIAGTPAAVTADDYFYKLDMHWTTAGAKEMAQGVAAKVKDLPVYASLKKTEFVTENVLDGINEGHYAKALNAICGTKLGNEIAQQERTKQKDYGHDANALFGDQELPEVVLVGTSNSNRDDFDLNFSGALKQFISTDIYNAAIAGGGIDDAIIAYLSSDMYKKSPAKVLIWEIPGYYNFNGEAMESALAEILPNVYGDCTNPLAESEPYYLGPDEYTMLEGLDTKNLVAGKYYLSIAFDKSVRKKFELSLGRNDADPMIVKFANNRSKDKRNFFYAPVAWHLPFKSVTIRPSRETISFLMTARVCPFP